MDTNTIIKALGGIEATAALCGIKASAVRKWRQNGVPSKHWAIIVLSSDVTFEQLARLETLAHNLQEQAKTGGVIRYSTIPHQGKVS